YHDFVVSTDMTWGSAMKGKDFCGFLFRLVNDDNKYFMTIDRLNNVYFDAEIDGEWEGKEPSVDSNLIQTGHEDINQLMIVGLGDTFTIYVNGQLAVTYAHSKLAAGRISLMGGTYNSTKGPGCTFRNSWIWDLSPNYEPEMPVPTIPPTPVPTAAPFAPEGG